MKRSVIFITVLCLLCSFSVIPTYAQLNERISNLLPTPMDLNSTENEESTTPTRNYINEINKLGIAGRPESDNAAPYYQRAVELYVEQPNELRAARWTWPDELSADKQALLRQWIQDNDEALEQLRLGSQKKYCWFKYIGRTLHETKMPYLQGLRNLTRALRARSVQQAQTGDITNAVDDVISLYKVGAHITNGPKPLVEKLVGIAIKSMSIKTAFNLLDKKVVNASMMKGLEDKFKQHVEEYSEPFDIRGEKFHLQEQVETNPKARGLKPYLNSTLEYYDTVVAKTPWQLHNETKSITEKNPLIETAGSGIPSVIELESRIRADEQALITTLALLRYNADKGGYPANFSDIVSAGYLKELPIDPFSNKPFVYKQTRNNFTLYSYAADFDDDGGVPSKWGRGEEGGDQVFWPLEAAGDKEQRIAVRRTLTGEELQRANESLRRAVVSGDINQVRSLISDGADINARDRIGGRPLHAAVQNHQQGIIELLIAQGADINAKNNTGQTPLHLAVNFNQKDAVELLIEKGADVNVVSNRRENALTLARKRRNTEIEELLLAHGAEEPSIADLDAGPYGRRGLQSGQNLYPDYESERTTQPGTAPSPRLRTRPTSQSTAQVDILADPNEIRARVKTFEGLEKALAEVADESRTEMRQWQQTRIDNRTSLVRSVQTQYEDELGLIRKAAVDEKAQNTTETVDNVLSAMQEQFTEIGRELQAQRREQRQTQQIGRGRGRTTGRGSRGQSTRGQTSGVSATDPYGPYGRAVVDPRTNRPQSTGAPSEQVDRAYENEIRQWLQATVDDKTDLASAVHEQIRAEMISIRNVAVEEKAQKTTATIDGLLLARQERFEEVINKIEEARLRLEQRQQRTDDLLNRARGGGRYQQDSNIQQNNQPRTRGRRR